MAHPRPGEFFGVGALEPGESIHRDDLNALTPSVGLGSQPGFEDLLGAARDHVQEPGEPMRSWMGVTYKTTVTILVAVRVVVPYVFIHSDDAHAVEPSWIIDQ